jgi:hypothetical protein
VVGRLDAQGQALVNIQSDWSRGNTTNTPLGSDETFTGEGEQNNYPDVMVSCKTDAAGTLYLDFSSDGTNWETSRENGYSVLSGENVIRTELKGPQWFRVRLVNGTAAQSYLRLYSYYGSFNQSDDPPNSLLAFSTTDLLGNGATYDSGVLDLREYTQVQTDILSAGAGGTITIDFVRDAAGSDILRTLTIPYVADSGYKTFSSLAFTPHVRYRFTTSSAGQTDFYFDTKFTKASLSPQILGVSDFISPAMVSTLTRSVVVGQTDGGDFLNVPVDGNGYLRTSLPTTAFGEVKVAENTPQVQVKYAQGINPDIVQTLVNKSGSTVAATDGLCTVTVAGAAEAFSQVRSRRVIRYGPGQGMDAKFTAGFPDGGLANSSLWAGPGDDDEMLGVGYNGTSFSIIHRRFGDLEVREITFTGGGDADGGTFTLTLDGTAVTITVPSGSATIADVCALVVAAATNIGNAGRGWEVHTHDSKTVVFISYVSENATGTFSFADVNSGVTAGTFTQATTKLAGAAPTETIVAQASWNLDVMDGTGTSGMTLDPAKINVWDVEFQYLGAGNITVSVENPATGDFVPVHEFRNANSLTVPTFRDPTLHLNMIAKTDAGFSGAAQRIVSSSMGGFLEGREADFGVRASASATVSTNGTTEVVNLVLHNEEVFNSASRNKVVVYPDQLTIINESTRSVIVEIYQNPTHLNSGVTLADVNSGVSVMQSGVGTGTRQGGKVLLPVAVSASSSKDVSVKDLGLRLDPSDTWAFVVTKESGGTDGNVTVAATWVERI